MTNEKMTIERITIEKTTDDAAVNMDGATVEPMNYDIYDSQNESENISEATVVDSDASTDEKKPMKPWVPIFLILVGIGLILAVVLSRGGKEKETVDNTSSEISETVDADTGATAETYTLSFENVDDCIVSFGNYINLNVIAGMEEVTDDMLLYYAESFFEQEAGVMAGRIAEEGDTVIIDYVGKIDDVAFDGGTASGQNLKLGSHSYIEGFEEGLIGAEAGEIRDLELMFPEEYHSADLAGKACVFTVTVQGVIPGLSDEGVASLGVPDYSTKDEYMASIKVEVENYYKSLFEDQVIFGVLDQVAATSEFNIPTELLAAERESVRAAYSESAYYYGVDVDTYLSYNGTTVDEVAESYAKQAIIFCKIAKEQNLEYTNEIDMISKVYDYLISVTNVTAE